MDSDRRVEFCEEITNHVYRDIEEIALKISELVEKESFQTITGSIVARAMFALIVLIKSLVPDICVCDQLHLEDADILRGLEKKINEAKTRISRLDSMAAFFITELFEALATLIKMLSTGVNEDASSVRKTGK